MSAASFDILRCCPSLSLRVVELPDDLRFVVDPAVDFPAGLSPFFFAEFVRFLLEDVPADVLRLALPAALCFLLRDRLLDVVPFLAEEARAAVALPPDVDEVVESSVFPVDEVFVVSAPRDPEFVDEALADDVLLGAVVVFRFGEVLALLAVALVFFVLLELVPELDAGFDADSDALVRVGADLELRRAAALLVGLPVEVLLVEVLPVEGLAVA